MLTNQLHIKRYLDAANLDDIQALSTYPWLSGITTNPSLVAKAGVKHYGEFARQLLDSFPGLDISFEVFADDIAGMIQEARAIRQWGDKVWVKVPIINSYGKSMAPVIEALSAEGIPLNITAIYECSQVETALTALEPGAHALLSVFAGRIADTGIDPLPIVMKMRNIIPKNGMAKLLWASTREAFNIVQANSIGCDIITAPKSLLMKAASFGKSLEQCSIDTVKTFVADAQKSGLSVDV